jgi:hypothetical protein
MAFVIRHGATPDIGSQIGQGIAGGISQGAEMGLKAKYEQEAEMQKMYAKKMLADADSNSMKDLLIKRGIPEDVASIYSQATEGGKTAILNNLLDLEQRGVIEPGSLTAPKDPNKIPSAEELTQEKPTFEYPKLEGEKGLKPAEKIKRQDKREATNIPIYNEANKTVRNLQMEGLSLQRLEQLNDSKKLPQNFGRLNVNVKSGELIAPWLAPPEAQLFVKTINDFTTKAKDSYGARVTNFELDRFMKRLPTLLNSDEGRRMIISQMKIINDLNALEHTSLRDVFDKYGVNKINAQEANQIARKLREDKEKELIESFNSLEGQLGKAPKAGGETPKERRPLGEFMAR